MAAEDGPDIHDLPDAEMGFIEPMKAKLVAQLPDGPGWKYEIKLDGYRALAVKAEGQVTIFSRIGNVLNDRFPGLAAAFAGLPDETMVDGEIVALDDEGRPSFNTLQNLHRRDRPVYFYAFDLLALKAKDTLRLPLTDRRILLENVALSGLSDPVRLSRFFETSAADLLEAARQQGLEGIVAKRATSVYESGERSGAWVKCKTNQSQELVIGGYIPGPHGFQSLLAGYYDEACRLLFIAKIKNGFVPALREQVARRFQGLESHTCPFANLPEPKNARRGEALTKEVMRKCRWLKPELVAQIEFTEWTAADHLRHSRFAGLRDDKPAREVRREKAAD